MRKASSMSRMLALMILCSSSASVLTVDLRQVTWLSPPPPTPILHGVLLSCKAPLGLGLAVELTTLHVVDAPFPGVRGEVPLDGVGKWARPDGLWRGASKQRPRSLRLNYL